MKRMYRQEWVPSIFNDLFDVNWMGRTKATVPAINVIEKKDEYKVQVAAPGMTKDDFHIHLDEAGDLVITMEKCCDRDEKEKPSKRVNAARRVPKRANAATRRNANSCAENSHTPSLSRHSCYPKMWTKLPSRPR